MEITKNEFELLTNFIIKKWGIDLDETKVYLVESRLSEVLTKFQCSSYQNLYERAQVDHQVASAIINAISTNETSFFRDEKTFDVLKGKLIPECLGQSKILNIWSAACSYGQEVYTLAMLIKELMVDPKTYKVQITGTDISDRTLAYASHGDYTEMEVSRGLVPARIYKHFYKLDGKYRINDDIRFLTYFQKMNLMEPFPFNKKFEIVLCRNVSIYFNAETKKQVYDRIANSIAPKGILIIGSSEMIFGLTDRFEQKEHNKVIYYQLKS